MMLLKKGRVTSTTNCSCLVSHTIQCFIPPLLCCHPVSLTINYHNVKIVYYYYMGKYVEQLRWHSQQLLQHFPHKYSVSRQESKFFEFTFFFVVKHASSCLISSTDMTKTTFIIILHDSLSPYKVNREAIQNWAVLEQFFTNFGQK